jgi:glycosyltransferase involved in cell wall biosynthesis
MTPELSILIPALTERKSELIAALDKQVGSLPVELLILTDNRKRSTGLKRQALLDLAQGRYITHLDDDDMVSEDYVEEVLKAIHQSDADVIVFNQQSTWNGQNPFIVRCGLEYENEGMHKDADDRLWQDIRRKPWFWCLWHSRIAKTAKFPDGYIDDDWFWLKQLIPLAKSQHRIDKVLHYYRYDSSISASNQGTPTCK